MTEFSRLIDKVLYINWGHGTDADTTPYNDVSDDVVQGSLKVSWGRDQARSFAPARVESLEAVLHNNDGTYNNAAGPLAGFVNRGPDTAAYLTHSSGVTVDSLDVTVDDETWTVDDPESVVLFRGFIEQAPQTIASIRSVAISALGILQQFVNHKVTIPLMENTRVDLILQAICDQIGNITPDLRFFDEGDTTIQYFWMSDQSPIPVFPQLVQTEGPNAAIFTNNYAELHFQGNQYRLNNYRSNTVQWYLYDQIVGEDPPFRGAVYHNPITVLNQSPDEVYNQMTFNVNVRELDAVAGQKWSYGAPIVIGPSQSFTIYATTNEPVKNAIVPVAGTDYQVTAGAVSSIVLSATGGTRIGITITAGAAGASIIGPTGQESDGLFLRAQGLPVTHTPPVASSEDVVASIARFRQNSPSVSVWPELNINTAIDISNAIVRRYKAPRDQLTLVIHNIDVHSALFILRCQISDRISVSVAAQGILSDYFIENKMIEVLGNGLVRCTIGCEIAIDEEAFRFGVDSFGNNIFG